MTTQKLINGAWQISVMRDAEKRAISAYVGKIKLINGCYAPARFAGFN